MINLDGPTLDVEIIDFEQFNDRKDVKYPSWIRLDNAFLEDPKFDDASHATIVLWLYLATRRNKARTEVFQIGLRMTKGTCRLSDKDLAVGLKFLIDCGKIKIHGLDQPAYVTCPAVHVTRPAVLPRDPGSTGEGEGVTGEGGGGSGGIARPPTPNQLAEVWNQECLGKMAKCVEVKSGTERAKAVKARLGEEPDLEAWRLAIRRAARNPFVRGELPGRDGRPPFRADIDWLTRPNTRIEILEGKYDPKVQEHGRKATPLFTVADLAKL